MSDISSLRDTIIPKADQINFDDVQVAPVTVRVVNVRRGDKESPVFIDLEGYEGRAFKPCKTVRRLIINAWGDDGRAWIGRSMTLYGDPTVVYGGVKVGGIRVSHMSDLENDMTVSLTATRGKRVAHTVKKLSIAMYPQDKFEANIGAWHAAIAGGKATADAIIAKVQQSGKLTDEQIQKIKTPQEAAQ